MRFISAFISTLLSASTALSQELQPYAGYRATIQIPGIQFVSASARVQIPPFFCNEFDPVDEIIHVGAAIGDPFTCGGGGIEIGFALICRGGQNLEPSVYWKIYPNDVHVVHPRLFPRGIVRGDYMYVKVEARGGYVFVFFKNNSLRGQDQTGPHRIARIDPPMANCLTTATWGARADIRNNREFMPIPMFEVLYFHVLATDSLGIEYTPLDFGVEPLIMHNFEGDELARPHHARGNAFDVRY